MCTRQHRCISQLPKPMISRPIHRQSYTPLSPSIQQRRTRTKLCLHRLRAAVAQDLVFRIAFPGFQNSHIPRTTAGGRRRRGRVPGGNGYGPTSRLLPLSLQRQHTVTPLTNTIPGITRRSFVFHPIEHRTVGETLTLLTQAVTNGPFQAPRPIIRHLHYST